MKITVTMEIALEKLPALTKALEGLAEDPVPVPEVPAVVAAPSEPVVRRSAEGPGAVQKEPASVDQRDEPVTKTMIRARGLELTKAGKTAELGDVFKKFGAEKLSGLKEENYEEAYCLMGELL